MPTKNVPLAMTRRGLEKISGYVAAGLIALSVLCTVALMVIKAGGH